MNALAILLGLTLSLVATATDHKVYKPATCAQIAQASASGPADSRLNHFFTAQWKYMMTEYPEFATYVGYPGQNDRWSDRSRPAIKRHEADVHCTLKILKSIPRAALSAKSKVNYDLARHELEQSIAGDAFPGELMPVNQMGGVQTDPVDIFSAMPAGSASDFENILTRLEKLPVVIAEVEALMREGMAKKVTPPKIFMPRVTEQLTLLTPAKVEDSPLFRVFADMAPSIDKADQEKIRGRAKEILQTKVYPAYLKFKDFVTGEYTPAARDTVAWSDLPNGKAWYEYLIKHHTTVAATADELHETGLREVARITAAMNKIKDRVEFKGDLKAFNKFLMTDKKFYFNSEEELLNEYRDIAKRIDPELPKMFRTLPRLTYGVREIPAFRAISSAGAEYQGGTLEAGRPGWFQANTYDLKSRPKWAMETLTFHEGVPGHHFQIALAQELEDMPNFRKYGGNTAYGEGWALYAESLGEEMGFFKDPYQLYGHYADEILRAVRLVVDTGMHAKGWSREKALEYFHSSMPTSDVESQNEINRYLVWPGQALAYKVGQLKIRELREKAHAELGDTFDIRSFHDVVLLQGSLPMGELEKLVMEWVTTQKKTTKPKAVKI